MIGVKAQATPPPGTISARSVIQRATNRDQVPRPPAARPPGRRAASPRIPATAPTGRCRPAPRHPPHASLISTVATPAGSNREKSGHPKSRPGCALLIVASHPLFLRQIMLNGTIAGHARRPGHDATASTAPLWVRWPPTRDRAGQQGLSTGKAQPNARESRPGWPVGQPGRPPAGRHAAASRAGTGGRESRKERRLWRLAAVRSAITEQHPAALITGDREPADKNRMTHYVAIQLRAGNTAVS